MLPADAHSWICCGGTLATATGHGTPAQHKARLLTHVNSCSVYKATAGRYLILKSNPEQAACEVTCSNTSWQQTRQSREYAHFLLPAGAVRHPNGWLLGWGGMTRTACCKRRSGNGVWRVPLMCHPSQINLGSLHGALLCMRTRLAGSS